MIRPGVERFEDEHKPGRLTYLGAVPEIVNHIGRLIVPLQTVVIRSGDKQSPFGVDTLGEFNTVLDYLYDVLADFFVVCYKRFSADALQHEGTQIHVLAVQFLDDFADNVRGLFHQAIVKDCPETLIRYELDVIDWIGTRVLSEHSKCRCIFEFKLF